MQTDIPDGADAPIEPNDADTAAAVLRTPDANPGGGGLGGQDAGRPADRPTPDGADPSGAAAAEARQRALGDGPAEAHPGSL